MMRPALSPVDPARELILIRTHYCDDDLVRHADALASSGRQVCLFVDELQGAVATPPRLARLTLDSASLAHAGLRETRQTGWQCGDYALSLAADAYPEVSHFWVTEPDLLLNFADPAEFFDSFAPAAAVDLLACALRPADGTWFWHGSAAPHFPQVWRCLFPLVRASRRAVDSMRAARSKIAARLGDADLHATPTLWPNDEALTASACQAAGLICRDFNQFGRRYYDHHTFSFDVPRSLAVLKEAPADRKIHHPVLAGNRLLAKVTRHLESARETCSLDLLSRIDARVVRDVARECGAPAAQILRESLAATSREIEPRRFPFIVRTLAYRARRWWRGRA